MITVSDLTFQFGGQLLFKDVDLKFTPGNCYGIIGANGAGKSTFLKLLCGELEPTHGSVTIPDTVRMSVLKQDHFAYDSFTVLDTVIQGNMKLYEIMKEKDAIYAKDEMTDEDGMRASELEGEFAELNGWEAESDASKLLQGLGIPDSVLYDSMSTLRESEKVKVLLAQALFGNPDIILLDEPTSGLDPVSRDELLDIFRDTVANGERSILFSTHIISDLEKCADLITYIHNGKILTSTDRDTFTDAYRKVTGGKEELTDAVKESAIGLREQSFGFEAMMKTEDAMASGLAAEPIGMEDIMVHIEREGRE
mgnify:CR=1 FL=1